MCCSIAYNKLILVKYINKLIFVLYIFAIDCFFFNKIFVYISYVTKLKDKNHIL